MNIPLFALASAVACQPAADSALLGFWESAATSQGGIGGNIEFRQDGSYASAIAVQVDLAYEVKNGKLYIGKNAGEPVSYETAYGVQAGPDALIVTDPGGAANKKMRITPSAGDAVVGRYRYRHYTGGIAYEQYTPAGLMKLRIPMRALQGCYVVTGDGIEMTGANQTEGTVPYALDGLRLRLGHKDGWIEYHRVAEGAWYDSTVIDYKKPDD